MKKTAFLIVVSLLLFGCGTQQSSTPKPVKKKAAPSNTSLAITNVQVTKNDGQNLDVALTADNNTDKAIYIHSSDFALSTGTITLSPTSQSNVPAQIPANSNTNITLSFDVKGQLSGTIEPKLDFQPSDNQPEQFEALGSVNIPLPQNPVSNPTTSDATSKPTQPISITIVQPSTRKPFRETLTENQSDINQDVAFATQRLGEGYSVSPYPDASVPDGFGGMLYAFIVRSDGDGTTQQIYFFINNRFLGTDTSDMHGPTTVVPGSTGTIIASYAHYLSGDPMSNPTGIPYTCSFYWNGSKLIPSNIPALNEINQTRN